MSTWKMRFPKELFLEASNGDRSSPNSFMSSTSCEAIWRLDRVARRRSCRLPARSAACGGAPELSVRAAPASEKMRGDPAGVDASCCNDAF